MSTKGKIKVVCLDFSHLDSVITERNFETHLINFILKQSDIHRHKDINEVKHMFNYKFDVDSTNQFIFLFDNFDEVINRKPHSLKILNILLRRMFQCENIPLIIITCLFPLHRIKLNKIVYLRTEQFGFTLDEIKDYYPQYTDLFVKDNFAQMIDFYDGYKFNNSNYEVLSPSYVDTHFCRNVTALISSKGVNHSIKYYYDLTETHSEVDLERHIIQNRFSEDVLQQTIELLEGFTDLNRKITIPVSKMSCKLTLGLEFSFYDMLKILFNLRYLICVDMDKDYAYLSCPNLNQLTQLKQSVLKMIYGHYSSLLEHIVYRESYKLLKGKKIKEFFHKFQDHMENIFSKKVDRVAKCEDTVRFFLIFFLEEIISFRQDDSIKVIRNNQPVSKSIKNRPDVVLQFWKEYFIFELKFGDEWTALGAMKQIYEKKYYLITEIKKNLKSTYCIGLVFKQLTLSEFHQELFDEKHI